MTKGFLFLWVAVAIGFTSCQSTTTQPVKTGTDEGLQQSAVYTTIQWLDSTLDKGAITEGEKIEISYRFKNTGDQPLVIKEVRPSCGCTVAEKPLEPVAPGKEGYIKALFNSEGKPGPNHKTITVISNTQPEIYQLSFNVIVNKKG